MLLGDILGYNVRRHHDRPALIFEDRSWTYAELHDRVGRLTAAVRGVTRPGDRIAVYAENRPEYVECYYGVPMAGAGLVFVNYRLHPREVSRILGDAEPAVVVTEPKYLDAVLTMRPDLPSVHTVVVIGGAGDAATVGYEDFLAAAPAAAPTGAPDGGPEPGPTVDPGDLAWLIYTSGTTGMPKGAMLSHRSLLAAVANSGFAAAPAADVVTLFPWPLCHVAGYSILLSHLTGATLVLMRSYDTDAFLAAIEDHRVTATSLAPTMLNLLLDDPRFAEHDLSSLRTVGYGAAAMPVEVLRRAMDRLPGVDFATGFGMTELSGNVMSLSAEAHREAVSGDSTVLRSVGRQLPLSTVRVVDDDLRDVEVGAVGEIVVQGDQVLTGYWRNEEATKEAFAGGWFHTGDLARWDEAGHLYIVDRKKDMIITGGENVYSREVEEVLYQHPAVGEAGVVGVPDVTWGENVVACIQVRPGASVTEAEIIDHCRQSLAGYKKPKRVVFIDELPRNAAGKILKRELRDRLAADA